MLRIGSCYVCLEYRDISPRGRCAECEYTRCIANEKENDELREKLDVLSNRLDMVSMYTTLYK